MVAQVEEHHLPCSNRLRWQARKWIPKPKSSPNVASTYELDHAGSPSYQIRVSENQHGNWYCIVGRIADVQLLLNDPYVKRLDVTDKTNRRIGILVRVDGIWLNFSFTAMAARLNNTLKVHSAKKRL
jgi:hypothetical protein